MASPAGIQSFRAMCPPSPRRGDSPPPNLFSDSIDLGSGIENMDLGGIQGIKLPHKPQRTPLSRRIAAATQQFGQREVQPAELLMSRSLPTLSDEFAPDVDDVTIRLRSCQILLPSKGTDNDALRIRNSGRKLHGPLTPLMPRMREIYPEVADLRHTFSEASFPSASAKKSAPGYSPMEPLSMRAGYSHVEPSSMRAQTASPSSPRKTQWTPPRATITPKGAVRKASTLHMTYPGLQPVSRVASPSRDTRADLLQKYTFRSASPPSHSTKMKSLGSTRNADDLAAAASRKSLMCRDALFNLRRLGKEEESGEVVPSSPGASSTAGKKRSSAAKKMSAVVNVAGPSWSPNPSTDEQSKQTQETNEENIEISASPDEQETLSPDQQQKLEKETGMLVATLNGVRDSALELQEKAKLLLELQDPVAESGGARHPTAIIAQRNLSVVKRKAELLEAVEMRLSALESKCNQKEELFKQVSVNAEPALEAMLGVRQFVWRYAHKPEDNPGDADKSCFEIFVSTFGIHRKHMHFERMMNLANETALWWSQEALRKAQDGAESDEIKRHMDVINGIGADKAALAKADEAMKACAELLATRLAEQCLKTALKLQEKDKMCVERSNGAQPQSAKDCATAINDDMRRAVALGASQKHPAMQEAKQIAMSLESEEKVRYGLEALLAAQKIQKQDSDTAAAYEKKEGVPPVGPASDAADTVDKRIKDAIKKGAVESHEHIQNAVAIAKQLRDTDGIRKRTANRAKRTSGS